MKLWAWVLGALSIMAVSFWLIVRTDASPIPLAVFVIGCAVGSVGAFWMMYVAMQQEKRPWPMIWLFAFVPFSCLWYYFERVRPRRGRSSRGAVRVR
jgi:multisubunit Na+/H+ antiporter MnhE subunit